MDENLFEEGTSVVSAIKNYVNEIQNKTFSLYISDDDEVLKMHLQVGKWEELYIHKPQENLINWVPNVYDSEPGYYFLWRVPVSFMLVNIADGNTENPSLKSR